MRDAEWEVKGGPSNAERGGPHPAVPCTATLSRLRERGSGWLGPGSEPYRGKLCRP
jgi:hypothetical protein